MSDHGEVGVILVTILSLIGVVLNIYKKRSGFIVWAFTNAAWCIYDFRIGAWEQGGLFLVYFVLAGWGWFKWGK